MSHHQFSLLHRFSYRQMIKKELGQPATVYQREDLVNPRNTNISILELRAVKVATQTFTKHRDVKVMHLQVDNIIDWQKVAKEIWNYHFLIKITAGYLPSDFNIAADRES